MQSNKALTSAGCDIRDVKFISNISNVFIAASLTGARNKAAGHALYALLSLSMSQVPAASIDSDDEVIASLCFLSIKEWSEVKNQVLKHFTLWIKQLLFCKFRELVLRCCAYAANQGFMVR